MKTKALLIAVAFLGLAGCKTIEVKDGRVPNAYMSQAQQLVGTYRGQFNGVPGDLVVRFDGNRPEVTYINSQGSDLLNNGCQSSIGSLERVSIRGTEQHPQLSSARFAFSPGSCGQVVEGREVNLSFHTDSEGLHIIASVFEHWDQREICNVQPPGPPMWPPHQSCNVTQNAVYLRGDFLKL